MRPYRETDDGCIDRAADAWWIIKATALVAWALVVVVAILDAAGII